MRRLTFRRLRNLGILVVVALFVVAVDALGWVSLHSMPTITGWLLVALILLLASYSIRKKLPFLPLGSSATWLQIHIYSGLLTAVVFLLHIQGRFPRGRFEILLGCVYLTVFTSGILGLTMSRVFARLLTTRGEEVFFERIPLLCRQLQFEVEKLVLQCYDESFSSAIPTLYLERLKWFFDKPRNFLAHVLQSRRYRYTLLDEMTAQDRFLSDSERQVMEKLVACVRKKDDLDYHYALQGCLKYWLFVHVPLTYALLVFAGFHIVLVRAFSGGIR